MIYSVEGIVIRSMDYGEGNKILTIFTREMGKIAVMARGAKKVNSRHTGVSQVFTLANFVLFKKGQMGTLNNGEVIQGHQKLREDLHQSAYAFYLVEMTYRLMDEGIRYDSIYEQLAAGLDAIEVGKEAQIISHIYEMKMLAISGYTPQLTRCVSCGNPAEQHMSLSLSMGGLLCLSCKTKDPSVLHISEGTRKVLQLFQQMDLRRLGNITLKDATKKELKQSMRAYMDTYMDVQWKSRQFLDQMEKYNL